MAQRKPPSTSTEAMVASRNMDVVAVPAGIRMDTEEEKILWEQFTTARNSWRDFDLLLIAKMVKAEVDIRRIQEDIKTEGFRVENARGTIVENALLRVEDTKQRLQLAIIGKLSLGVSANSATTQNAHATKQSESKQLKELKGKSVASLLAQ